MCPVNTANRSNSSSSRMNIRGIPDMHILSVAIGIAVLLLCCHTQAAAATALGDTINIGFLAEYSEMRVSEKCSRQNTKDNGPTKSAWL